MPAIIFSGPEGRLEGRYHPQDQKDAPVAIVLHPDPRHGGTMNNKVAYNLHYCFYRMGFAVLRFNFRGVGRSQPGPTAMDEGVGELADAASALDYIQAQNPNSKQCWVAGFSFGAWIGMQLLMRRPEITGFVSVAPPTNRFDFSFLAPCPSSGLIVNGTSDVIAPASSIDQLVAKLQDQRGITIAHTPLEGAGHFFENAHMDSLVQNVTGYVSRRLTESTR
ncbi:MAG: alpha/beta hydrolase [Rhodobacteraceae bacterium]|nr:alpha/beta hydrolase [Paracoccaceae bacterium]